MSLHFFLILFVSTLASECFSISVLNNETVSRDFLSDLFFEGFHRIRDENSTFNSSTESQKCYDSLLAIINQYPSPKVNRFFDSWGNFPSGIEYGNLYDVGNFDQCVKTSVTLDELPDVVDGKFCFARIPLSDSLLKKNDARLSPLPDKLYINIGICVPDSCSPKFLTSLFNKSEKSALLAKISISNCTNGKMPKVNLINIIGVAIFSTFGILMILSTIYDFFTRKSKKTPEPCLLAFSILTNGKKLFKISSENSPKNIGCLTGIRVLSMVMIINFHTYLNTSFIASINEIDNLPWSKTLWSFYIINAGMAVDSFFFISGLLAAWTGFQKMDETKGKLNIGMMYFHRYIRLTPVMGATILFVMSLNELTYSGPFREIVLSKNQCNSKTWWPNLLYIQNYYYPHGFCNNETWYLAADFQLYILSPLLLIPLWKWRAKFSPVLFILVIISVGQVMATYITENFTGLLNVAGENKWAKTYIPTHARCPPWLVGLALGYFLHNNRERKFQISKIVQLIAWIASLTILIAIVFGPYLTSDGRGSVLEAAIYGGWKHFSWGVALAWITFACHFGFGGVVNSFLSHPFWQPLGRLTYSMYLTNMIVLGIHFGMMRTPVYFSDYNEILYFWSAFGMTFVAAIVMALIFEYPVLVLENCIFGKKKIIKTANVQQSAESQL